MLYEHLLFNLWILTDVLIPLDLLQLIASYGCYPALRFHTFPDDPNFVISGDGKWINYHCLGWNKRFFGPTDDTDCWYDIMESVLPLTSYELPVRLKLTYPSQEFLSVPSIGIGPKYVRDQYPTLEMRCGGYSFAHWYGGGAERISLDLDHGMIEDPSSWTRSTTPWRRRPRHMWTKRKEANESKETVIISVVLDIVGKRLSFECDGGDWDTKEEEEGVRKATVANITFNNLDSFHLYVAFPNGGHVHGNHDRDQIVEVIDYDG